MQEWAGKTLNERCQLFHRCFPDTRISPSSLSRIYKKYKIKRKRIYQTKRYFIKNNESHAIEVGHLKQEVSMVLDGGYNIIFLDETMFTYNTLFEVDYSNRGSNIVISEKACGGKTIAVVACVSLMIGLESYMSFYNSINKGKFLRFVKFLKQLNRSSKFAIFMDNLRVHHNHEIKEYCNANDIPLIYNVPYTPELNPIEEIFSLVKNWYKRLKLNSIATT